MPPSRCLLRVWKGPRRVCGRRCGASWGTRRHGPWPWGPSAAASGRPLCAWPPCTAWWQYCNTWCILYWRMWCSNSVINVKNPHFSEYSSLCLFVCLFVCHMRQLWRTTRIDTAVCLVSIITENVKRSREGSNPWPMDLGSRSLMTKLNRIVNKFKNIHIELRESEYNMPKGWAIMFQVTVTLTLTYWYKNQKRSTWTTKTPIIVSLS